jgi:hypothetical protein
VRTNVVRTTHGSAVIYSGNPVRIPDVAPWINTPITTLGGILSLPFMRQPLISPVGIGACILERNPCNGFVRPPIRITAVLPVFEEDLMLRDCWHDLRGIDSNPVVANFGLESRVIGVQHKQLRFLDWHVAIDTVCGNLCSKPGKLAALLLLVTVKALSRIAGGRTLNRVDVMTGRAGHIR